MTPKLFGSHGDVDLEKSPRVDNAYESRSNETTKAYDNVSDGAVPGESFEYGDSMYARIQRIAGKFNVEQRGIERVPENERTDTSYFNISSMWLAANMVVSSFAIGVLSGSTFYLGFVDAILVCLFFNLLGVLTVCFFSCFGPAFGLRQMVLSRFWFGWFPVKFSELSGEVPLVTLMAMANIPITQSPFSMFWHASAGLPPTPSWALSFSTQLIALSLDTLAS